MFKVLGPSYFPNSFSGKVPVVVTESCKLLPFEMQVCVVLSDLRCIFSSLIYFES